MIHYYIGCFIFLVAGFFMARKDTREGIIPDDWTNIGIIFGVAMNFFALGFFSFYFYLYFTILLLLYLFFMCLQYAMHYSGKELGTGDIKMLLFVYALIPFNVSAFVGLPILNIIFWTIVIMFVMLVFKLLYYLVLNKLPIYKIMYGSTLEKTSIRLAPLIYLSFLITFFTIL